MADLIIGDDNWESLNSDIKRPDLCGTLSRNFDQVPYGSLPFAGPYDAEEMPIIPMEEWPDLIADTERSKSSLKDVWADARIGVWNQDWSNYCHAFSSVMGMMITNALMGLPKVELSPSSVGAPITGYRNEGEYIHNDLQQMVRVGVASIDFVPRLTIKKSDFKPGWQENAAKHRATEYIDVPARNFLVHGSLLLLRYPVVVGLNYWGHAVLDLVLKDLDTRLKPTDPNRYGSEFLNSWHERWGNKGFGIRSGSKKFADAIYALRQSTLG